ncbi:MAG: type I restriction enzyme HsdR N-terminal domain-containing protein [Bacteroidales bacterium]|nr:type I restriction enzyme HsdR N-terminal domain-containing protein [Bacteroidales bacterium]
MKQLHLPEYSFRIITQANKEMIFDPLRKKYVRLNPEEWVRQNFVQYLIQEGKYPPGLIGVEVMFIFNRLRKRADILVHNRKGEPVLIVECKSPDIKLDDQVFDQIATYNLQFRVPWLVVTNGMTHYACRFDPVQNKFNDLLSIPLYEDLLT